MLVITAETEHKQTGTYQRSFRWLLAARSAGIIAYQMVAVAVGWQMYSLTGRPLDLGLVGLVQFIPSALLVLVVGHTADRYDRRRIVTLAQLLEAPALLVLVGATLGQWISREVIFSLIFVIGCARAFEFTTMQTMVPSLVEPEELPRAMAARSATCRRRRSPRSCASCRSRNSSGSAGRSACT